MRATRWTTRLAAALQRPIALSVRGYLAARDNGRIDVEDAFLSQLKLESGVFKATRRHRFDETFPLVLASLARRGTSLRVLDVACSSGISSVELHRAIVREGHAVETIGTDIATSLQHLTHADGTELLCDRTGHILAAEVGGILVSRRPTRAMKIFHPLRVARARRLIERLGGRVRRTASGFTREDIPLVSSAVEGTGGGVRIVEEDMLAPTVPGRFSLIRAANILNRGYFGEAQLSACVRALLARLEQGGSFFVVRTDGIQNHGTLWVRTPDGLRVAGAVGSGSEIGSTVERTAAHLYGTARTCGAAPPGSDKEQRVPRLLQTS